MNEHRENFEAWFGTVLEKLMNDRNAGFVVVMATFPLLERYLIQKSSSKANSKPFNEALFAVLPELGSVQAANMFWSVFRHGLLHQVALQKATHRLSHDLKIVEFDAAGNLWMNPNKFAQRILDTIRADFETYERGPSLPQVSPVYGTLPAGNVNPAYMGTWAPPRGTGE